MGRATRDEIDAGVTQSIKSFAPNLDPQVKQRTYKHIHPSCADDECPGLSVNALGGCHCSVVSSAPTMKLTYVLPLSIRMDLLKFMTTYPSCQTEQRNR